ncbi:hypothetical protein C7U92_28255 [Bradyrhizobium sp. WBOS7]|uniref:Uncharacterized protein n=1 Tax=Bradyrhizobium betae TaxID=244734 RepID=A0AAE9N8V3_9BRAD|nr:hypothetical protein [Bradyrhizobium sp. WBOS2]MDD1574548.1 hypothetical protein [Bradyrhizobium sp. WBOS1]MDD1580584.1 hypothetical protein [Bradyrhizobium sp. WBOS7]MDD1603866.1 hypothetical protein [Bradyrhizobium sp. WBOS16]UUO34721.1 hypothetical protein DCK84_09165 [Bradyrhizobium sp. WBOS01]UUO41049.1 hypothetical protein DCM75_10015 [Bradyrhizobium sp. WBOS02]UUO55367.1 hypothetical protein DCM79_21710 [Bradyrhizobium sp. WBOS07]UUO65419.1 hypothetical protein DCM83_09495 [Bradyrh
MLPFVSGYVDLKRSFVPVADDAEPELAIGHLWGRKYGGWLDWPDVLNHPRVVVLAEAQSGKTEEFKNTTAELRDRGTPAFYATIEQLAEGRLNLSPPQRALFESWKAGAEPGWFFLDSVDEARLNRKKFDDALHYLAAEIGAALARASILVSCRVSDWKGKSDRQTILDILPVPPPPPAPAPPPAVDPDAALLDPIFEREEPEKPKRTEKGEKKKPDDLLVIRLVPLTDEQRKAFALAKGVRDVDAFMAAIDRQGLDVLAERPGDMLDLIQYWADHNKFGTLTTMTEAAIEAKLREPDRYRPDNTDLAPAKARAGVERVAAALTLAKTFTLIAPGQEPDLGLASGALDAVELLNDWNVAESNALLRRGIFAPSTYGRVRFHHRSTQEYLTACWLKRLLDGGCPLSEVFGLIFTERYGVETVAPSLRAPAAWLAHHYPDIRDEIIRREPLLLITYGDPAALSIESKTAVLLNLARKHAAGEIADDSIDRRALGMFASPDLSDAIHEAWKINSRADFRNDLIRTVREGRIAGCTDLAEKIACDGQQADQSRITAVDALVACEADDALRRVTADLMGAPAKASPRLAAGFARALFPSYLNVVQLLTLIDKAKPPSSSSAEGFAYAIDELWQACPATDKPALIAGLAKLCAQPPFVHEYRRVAARQGELSRHLGNIAFEAVSTLGDRSPSPDLIALLAVVERAERPIGHEGDGPELNLRVRQNRALNRALFWHDAEEARNAGHTVQDHWQVHFGGTPLWALESPDLEWLRDDLKNKPLQDDRRVALSALVQLIGSQLKTEAPALRKLIGKDPKLREDLRAFLRPRPVSPAIRRMNERSAKNKTEKEARKERDKATWRDFRDKLQANIPALSDPSTVVAGTGFWGLHNLSQWLLKKTREQAPSAIRQWRLLEPAFSKEIAEGYRDGMKALWRVQPPEKPVHAPGGGTTVKWITIYAYAAIGLEAADNPRFPEPLSESDARRAIQHVCASEQGYPDWLDGMIKAHPKIAVPLIRAVFKDEWDAAESRVSYFLYHFAQNAAAIHPDLQSAIFDVISTSEPTQINTFDRGLDIVRNLSLSDAQRAALRARAAARFGALKKSNTVWAARYIALLFLLGEPSAVTLLTAWLRGEKPSARQTLTITVLGLLFGGHHPLIVGVLAALSIPILSQLTLFAYQEIRPDEDNVHEGMYSPDDRDDAENARSAILKALMDSEGPAAFEAMIRLSRHAAMTARRIRFRELARRMAERDADVVAWLPQDVVAFEREKILPIKTGRDLYRVVQAIIREIDWEFVNADASARAVLETAKDENAVQQWLAAEMKQRAKGRYHASRESEVAEGNMPDILVAAIGSLVETAVEAKHGGKGWSTKALEDALRAQLAEDYLRPAVRRHGVLVVTNHKQRGWQHPKSRKAMTFPEMIAYLNGVAATLRKNKTGEITVSVIGIDAVKKPRTRAAEKPRKRTAKRKPRRSGKRASANKRGSRR